MFDKYNILPVYLFTSVSAKTIRQRLDQQSYHCKMWVQQPSCSLTPMYKGASIKLIQDTIIIYMFFRNLNVTNNLFILIPTDNTTLGCLSVLLSFLVESLLEDVLTNDKLRLSLNFFHFEPKYTRKVLGFQNVPHWSVDSEGYQFV